MYINQCISNNIQFNSKLQCIQISTRINSSKLYICTYVFVSFETTSSSKYSTWCQNRGCSYISSRRRIYRSNPAVSCIFPSILNVSTVELQFYQFFKRERKTDPGLQSSSTGRIFILCSSKALQAPQVLQASSRAQFPVSPSILHGRIFIPCCSRHPVHSFPCLQAFYTAESSFYAARGIQQFPVEFPCCSRRGILIIFHRISTCKYPFKYKVSGLRIYCVFCVSKCSN